MEEKKITLTLTVEQARELSDLLGRINDEYEYCEPYASKDSLYVDTFRPIVIFHSEAATIDKLLVQLNATVWQ